MYWREDEQGVRRPCANAPRATIKDMENMVDMLDRGAKSATCHAVFDGGETLTVNVSDAYARNSIGLKTGIKRKTLFRKRLEIDIEHLARIEWAKAHRWDEKAMGTWTAAIGITGTANPMDEETLERLSPVFPKTSLRDLVRHYREQHYGSPTPSIYTLIDIALSKNHPLETGPERISKSGLAYEAQENEHGLMGVIRDKRTGQKWMWPLLEEQDANDEVGMAPLSGDSGAFVPYAGRETPAAMAEAIGLAEKELGHVPPLPWEGPVSRRAVYALDRYQARKLEALDRRDIRRALDEELRRGGLPDNFDYPCRVEDGWISCDWPGAASESEPIILKGRPVEGIASRKQVGRMVRTKDPKTGLRWWRWETDDGTAGDWLPSFQQALLDFTKNRPSPSSMPATASTPATER